MAKHPALMAGMLMAAGPAQAQVATDARLSIPDALTRDAGTALSLISRQLAMPFTDAFGFPLLVAMLGAALVLAWPFRLWALGRLAAMLEAAALEQRLAITLKAVGTLVVTTLLWVLAGQIALGGLELTVTLLPETQVLAHAVAVAIGMAGLGLGVGRALRSPENKALRPLPLPPGLGHAIGFYPFAAALMLGLTHVTDQLAQLLHAAQTSWIVAQGVIVLIETIVIARFLIQAGHARERQAEAIPEGAAADVPRIFGMTALVWVLLAVGCIAFVLGHERFAMLVLQELLWAGLVLTIAWLLTRFFDALLSQLFDTDRVVGRFATGVVGMKRARIKQLALLGSALLTVIVWLFAIGLVTAPLHGDQAVVVDQLRPAPLLSSVHALHLSPSTVGMAVLVLIVGVALTRIMRGWLENRFLPSTSLDIGVRTSLVTGLSYVGIIIALLSATSTLGLQLEKITLIASALSVGIGFGLQSIIQNFVSGVILLIERPVKQGDWVAVSGTEGTIRRIRVRATELATADGGTAIVPNSSFISSNVANKPDTLMSSRLDLALTVAGCPTAAEARDAVLDLCKGATGLRDEPAPRLFLTTLGDAEWTFNLKVYARPGISVAQAKSDLLFTLSAHSEGREIKIKSA
jgi:small-conductance mechanosensitive channel